MSIHLFIHVIMFQIWRWILFHCSVCCIINEDESHITHIQRWTANCETSKFYITKITTGDLHGTHIDTSMLFLCTLLKKIF